MNFVFSKHALEQMKLRNIPKNVVEKILSNPEQIKNEQGKKVYQSIVENGKYLIRIFVNHKKNPKLIITVYKTSKITKYYEGKI
jgi:hypothetical protein